MLYCTNPHGKPDLHVGDELTLVEQYEGYALYRNQRGATGYLFPDDVAQRDPLDS